MERELPDLPDRINPESGEIGDVEKALLIRETQLVTQIDRSGELELQVGKLTDELNAEREARLQAAAETESLRVQVNVRDTQLQGLQSDVDRLQTEVAQVRADAEGRMTDAVRAAVAEAERDHQAERQHLIDARQQVEGELGSVRQELEEAKTALAESSVEGKMGADELALHFASVFDQVGEVTSESDKPYNVAVTGMEVEARGLITPEGEIAIPAPGRVDAGTLSTVRLEYRLVPRLPGGAQPPLK